MEQRAAASTTAMSALPADRASACQRLSDHAQAFGRRAGHDGEIFEIWDLFSQPDPDPPVRDRVPAASRRSVSLARSPYRFLPAVRSSQSTGLPEGGWHVRRPLALEAAVEQL